MSDEEAHDTRSLKSEAGSIEGRKYSGHGSFNEEALAEEKSLKILDNESTLKIKEEVASP